MELRFILPSLACTGPILFTRNLVSSLLDAGVKDFQVNVEYLDEKHGVEFPCNTTRREMRRGFEIQENTIFHSTCFRPDVIFAAAKTLQQKMKLVVGVHNHLYEDLKMQYSTLRALSQGVIWKYAMRLCRPVFVFSSEEMRDYYFDFLGEVDNEIIPYGVPPALHAVLDPGDEEIFERHRAAGRKILGMICGLIPRKGVDVAIRALALCSDCALIVIGNGPEHDRLVSLAGSLGVSDRISFLGFRERSSRYALRFDAFLMLSYSEGYCMAMIEAFSAGLPTCVSKLPIYNKQIPKEDVVYIEPGNVEQVAAGICRLLQNSEDYRSRALQLFAREFSVKKMALSHLKLYERLLIENRKSSEFFK